MELLKNKPDITLTLEDLVSGALSGLPTVELIELPGRYLPSQAPLTDFVHHNTLDVFLNLPFHTALETAAELFGAKLYDGQQSSMALESVSLRHKRKKDLCFDVDRHARPLMIRLSAAFFDQGVALVSLPHARLGFWNSVGQLLKKSYLPIKHLNKSKKFFKIPPEDAIELMLHDLVGERTLYPLYLFELMQSLRGWAGFCRKIEEHPELLEIPRPASLVEWMAIYLAIEWGVLSEKTYKFTKPRSIERIKPDSTQHDKNEWDVYNPILKSLKIEKVRVPEKTKYQAIFCIDDREFNLRHLIEKNNPQIETFGAPGFFGVDCVVSNSDNSYNSKHCPPAVSPSATVKIGKKKNTFWQDFFWLGGSHHVVGSWLLVQILGIPSALQFLASTLSPRFFAKRRLRDRDWTNNVEVFNDEIGYNIEQSALRVANFLSMIGLNKNFAPFIAVVGHGASSGNNPYFAAYDCGACSGRPGTISARAFCLMANDSKVRELVESKYKIKIPRTTEFVPFLHDTTADLIDYLGEGDKPGLDEFLTSLQIALKENAQFRCQHFDGSPVNHLRKAHRHVRSRAKAWYEPRPEYNHAKNVGAVVGPRNFGIGLPKDHGLFLHSYEHSEDQNGEVLGKILSAVIPVCGGINLEYFFSRIDPEVYGAGNKLPQNVVGIFGVMTGIESDLRTGLPMQMTETHTPVRLLLVVVQKKEILNQAIARQPQLLPWVDNGWVHLISQDPTTGKQTKWEKGLLS